MLRSTADEAGRRAHDRLRIDSPPDAADRCHEKEGLNVTASMSNTVLSGRDEPPMGDDMSSRVSDRSPDKVLAPATWGLSHCGRESDIHLAEVAF